MEAKDIFAGPIVRRAQPDMIAIWLATRNWFEDLVAVVRPVGENRWLGASNEHWELGVFPNLYVHLFIVEPLEPYEVFPTNTLLEYSIVGVDFQPGEGESFWDRLLRGEIVADFASFEKIVREDKLSYPDAGLALPTLYLQDHDRKLCALYASCRKIHDKEGGDYDALARGDVMIGEDPWDFSKRPALLALVGDQIYADDVHADVFYEVARVAKELAGNVREDLDTMARGKGQRGSFLRRSAGFTSDEAANHLITLAEYAAMYGLAWCPHNWSGPSHPEAVQSFVNDLPSVRRLMANTPTYMGFDDHDVTDDWNLSVRWKKDVWARPVGRRIIANALYAFWLFQGCGNDPERHRQSLQDIENLNDDLTGRSGKLGPLAHRFEEFFWRDREWEFATPTRPFIYFLDTRTQRGHSDGKGASDSGPPAFLKRVDSWKRTMARITELLRDQSRDYPLVLVAPAPVVSFRIISELQLAEAKVRGPYPHDVEQWPNNLEHLLMFFRLCRDYNVVLLSGDVHYGYTSTMKVSHFDDDSYRAIIEEFPDLRFPKKGSGAVPTYQFLYASKYLQLTSSGAKNYASGFLQFLSQAGREDRLVVNNVRKVREGMFHNGELRIVKPVQGPPQGHAPDSRPGIPQGHWDTQLEVVKLEDYKPSCALYQLYNHPYNSPYVSEHNIGYVVIDKKKIGHLFLSKSRQVGRTWDFANDIYWTSP